MVNRSIQQITSEIAQLGLLKPNELEIVSKAVAEAEDDGAAKSLADTLLGRNLVTVYQWEKIQGGEGKSLVLGNYLVLDKIGQGGMGVVLKARHRRMNRIVALKVMAESAMKSPESVSRFHREVHAAARVTHPNIVIAFDADEANGTHFLVMEFIEGVDLQKYVKQNGPFTIPQTVDLIVQAARGLQFAHRHGIVHRDIKPANLLLDRNGVVKILDMGLARLDEGVGGNGCEGSLTSTGMIMGTIDFMAPEQAMDTKHADARSDIYSLGCTLFYLLTGEVLFTGDTMMKRLMAHQSSAAPDLNCDTHSGHTAEKHAESLFAQLNFVYQKMVAKQPDDRFQNMEEVIAELTRFESQPVLTPVGMEPSGSSSSSSFRRPDEASGSVVAATLLTSAPAASIKTSETFVSSVESQTDNFRSRPTMMAGGGKRPTSNWILAAGFGGMMLLAGVLLIVRDRDGQEVGRIEVPAGGSVAVEEKAAVPVAASTIMTKPASVPQGEQMPSTIEQNANPVHQAFFDSIAQLPVEQQAEAVKKKLFEINNESPDAKLSFQIRDGKVAVLNYQFTTESIELWPVRGFPHLTEFYCRPVKYDEGNRDWESLGRPDLRNLEGLRLQKFSLSGTAVADLSPIQEMPLTYIGIAGTKVTDLSALKGMPLISAVLRGTRVKDLSPLIGCPLRELYISYCPVETLEPLRNMQLIALDCGGTRVSDLSPIVSSPLQRLWLRGTTVSDLSPLAGKPLTYLDLALVPVSDVTVLRGMNFQLLDLYGTNVTDISPLLESKMDQLSLSVGAQDLTVISKKKISTFFAAIPLFFPPDEEIFRNTELQAIFTIRWQRLPASEFWEKYDLRKAECLAFVESLQGMTAENQIPSVIEKLTGLRSDQSDQMEFEVEDGAVVSASVALDDRIPDLNLSPLRALSKMKRLTITSPHEWVDLSPVFGLPVEELNCSTQILVCNSRCLRAMDSLKTINGKPRDIALDEAVEWYHTRKIRGR